MQEDISTGQGCIAASRPLTYVVFLMLRPAIISSCVVMKLLRRAPLSGLHGGQRRD